MAQACISFFLHKIERDPGQATFAPCNLKALPSNCRLNSGKVRIPKSDLLPYDCVEAHRCSEARVAHLSRLRSKPSKGSKSKSSQGSAGTSESSSHDSHGFSHLRLLNVHWSVLYPAIIISSVHYGFIISWVRT